MDKSRIGVLVILVIILCLFMISKGNKNTKVNNDILLNLSKSIESTTTSIANISEKKESDDSIVPETSSSYIMYYIVGTMLIGIGIFGTYKFSKESIINE